MSRVVITMAGLGSRFRARGYDMAKYRIQVAGRSLFAWSVGGLQAFIDAGWKFTFVSLRTDNAATFLEEECARLGIANYDHIELDQLTNGQATTALMALHAHEAQEPLVIFNIDTGVAPDAITPEMIRGDGWLACFEAEGDGWSFADADAAGLVQRVTEKDRISDWCSIGFYAFKSQALFAHAYASTYQSDRLWPTREAYVAPLYQTLIDEGREIRAAKVPNDAVFCLGTPEQVEDFAACQGRAVTANVKPAPERKRA